MTELLLFWNVSSISSWPSVSIIVTSSCLWYGFLKKTQVIIFVMITIQVVNSVLRPSKISLLPRMGYCPKLVYLCFPRWGLIWILKVGKTDPPPSHWKFGTWFVTKVNFRNDHYWESIKMKQFYTLEHLLFLFCYIEPFKKLFRLQLVSRIKGIHCRSKLVAYKKLWVLMRDHKI